MSTESRIAEPARYPYAVYVPFESPCARSAEFSPGLSSSGSLAFTAAEVLAPAGNLATLQTAIDFGADAVYCGGQQFGMRAAPKNFTLEDFDTAVHYAHARGARVYAACNILPSSNDVPAMNAYMGQLADIGIDALIISDIGVLMAARQVAPHTELHVSTQAGITNYQAANAMVELGASRIVLARELDLEAIRQIRANIPRHIEIEAFVHGSMCMAFSGRCLISQHLTGRDANQGDCVQACRYKYHVVEEKRPGEFLPVEVTDQGSFIFNSQDMNLLEHVDDILDAGVTSLKIEGRAKGAYYVAVMANAYKTAVNAYRERRAAGDSGPLELPQWLREEPFKVTHREYGTGFYYPEHPASESVVRGGYINEWRWLGTVTGYDAHAQRLRIFARNKIAPGMEIEFLAPGGRAPLQYRVPNVGLQNAEGEPVSEINNPAHEFSLPFPAPEVPASEAETAVHGEHSAGSGAAAQEPMPVGAMIRARVAQ
ncbi:MAG: U32 family peptidase [Arcanobacterium sp.]|nr:U32 family peptidase [Arcanobacterium sp.]